MPFLSVIIPVYNAAGFLDECLSSLVAQLYRDIEIICVNDGSTDGSDAFLNKWAERDGRIKLLSQNNKGLSAARNAALDVALGEYVAFVDADDTVDNEMFPHLMERVVRDNLDAVGCCYKTFPEGKRSFFSFKTGEVLDFPSLLGSSQCYQSSNDLCLCWRYIFRKEILSDNAIRFREDILFAEDMVFNTEVLAHCNRIYLSDAVLYNYRVGNSSSLMGNKQSPERLSSIPLGYAAKRDQIRRFGMDRYSPCSRDLSEYTLKAYLPMLLDALAPEGGGLPPVSNVKGVISLPMIRESSADIGFRSIYGNWKEYVYYLSVKFRLARIVRKLYYS